MFLLYMICSVQSCRLSEHRVTSVMCQTQVQDTQRSERLPAGPLVLTVWLALLSYRRRHDIRTAW